MGNIVLCDIDGTIADNSHRQHFLEGKKDWEGFFSNLDKDKPIFPIINLINDHYREGKKIIFLSGRSENYRNITSEWLKKYFNFDFLLVLRKSDDKRNKLITKRELFNSLNIENTEVYSIFENDIDLIKMWNEMKLNVVNVNEMLI